MPPLWKIRRELLRFRGQVTGLPRAVFERFFATAYYDRVVAKNIRLRDGRQPNGKRKAIYLMFPANGVLSSHIRTLRYLTESGLSVTVVSNLPLSEEDEDLICSLSHQCIVRPNFGYDFGGYRDAVLAMENDLKEAEYLILLNDSAWFPLQSGNDWLTDTVGLGVDFAGAVSHYGWSRVEPADFRDFTFEFGTEHKNFHYGSFALFIGQRILKDPQFLTFWKRLILSDSKRKTVKYGETGLTQWVLKHGYSHADTLGVSDMRTHLSALSNDRLKQLVHHIITFEDHRLKLAKQEMIAALPNMSRDDLIRFVLTAGAFHGVGYVLAYFAIFDLGYPFLKKSPIWLDEEAAQTSFRILEELGTPAAQEALEEAKMLLRVS